jgi:hypothetical protein
VQREGGNHNAGRRLGLDKRTRALYKDGLAQGRLPALRLVFIERQVEL